ncbi:sensor histidine kinase [Paenibacillus sp. strain BS8-2]
MKKVVRGISFHLKLSLVFSLVFMLITVVQNVQSYKREVETIRLDSMKSMNHTVENAKESLETQIFFLSRISFALSTNQELINSLLKLYQQSNADEAFIVEQMREAESIAPMLTSYIANWNKVEGLSIYMKSGQVYYQSKSVLYAVSSNYQQEKWYASMLEQDLSQTPYIDNQGTGQYLSYIRRIVNPTTGEFLGYLKIDLNLGHVIEQILKSPLRLYEGRFYLVDGEQHSPLLSGGSPNASPEPLDLEPMGKDNQSLIDAGGKEFSLIQRQVDETAWQIHYEFDNSKTLANLKQAYEVRMYSTGLIVIAIFIIYYLLAMGMSKNIRRLAKGLRQIEKGNWSARVKIATQDEIGSLAHSFNAMATRLQELYDKMFKLELVTKEAQIKALQAQINPHFFYNAMASIDSLAAMGENERVSELTEALSNNFRYAFRHETMVTLAEELAHVQDYVQIMQVRYPNKIDFRIDVPKQIKEVEVPRMILQPLVENCIGHGALKQRGVTLIELSGKQGQEGSVLIEVSDTGVGIPESRMADIQAALLGGDVMRGAKEQHVGLLNVHHRLKFRFEDNKGLTVQSVPGEGTSVLFSIPISMESER